MKKKTLAAKKDEMSSRTCHDKTNNNGYVLICE